MPLRREPGASRAERVERREALAHRALRARALLFTQRATQVDPRRLDEAHVDHRAPRLATGDILPHEHLGKAGRARDVRVRARGLPRHVPVRRGVQNSQRAAGLGTQSARPNLPRRDVAGVHAVLAPLAQPLALRDAFEPVAAQVHLHVAPVAEDDLVVVAPAVGSAGAAHVARVGVHGGVPDGGDARRRLGVAAYQRGDRHAGLGLPRRFRVSRIHLPGSVSVDSGVRVPRGGG
mmetsp:Transcript_3629/g.15366  ORF Transcript_3629/g.15366 Transcript_3629/m.15366 type:complete len:235 (+) Transcript_3629:474-1178(+)